MRLLILQLGDIHFTQQHNPIMERGEAILRAVQATGLTPDACVLAVVGDVAYSGNAQEYAIANRFMDDLRGGIGTLYEGITVEEVYVPGNHDAFLPDAQASLRRVVVEHVLGNPQVTHGSAQGDASIVGECLKPLANFFVFTAARAGSARPDRLPTDDTNGRLFDHFDIGFNDVRVRFQCLNTAWLSQRGEKAGQLIAPVWLAEADAALTEVDLVVTSFHHPYTWLEPGNAKALRRWAERTSDVILTGHEHVPDQFAVERARAAGTDRSEYLEGAVLQDNTDDSQSGFRAILFDFARREYQATLFHWAGDRYAAEAAEPMWRPFLRGARHRAGSLEPTEQFAAYLADPGAAFTHPRKSDLALADIYVYPDVQDRQMGRTGRGTRTGNTVRGRDGILGYIREHRRVFVMGGERCGRTALAKTLWMDLLRDGYIPVLITGAEWRSAGNEAIRRVVSESVSRQYGPDAVERFWQLDKSRRALLVDDLHRCRLNHKGRNAGVGAVASLFETVVVFANDMFFLEEVSRPHGASEESGVLLTAFRQCEILRMGHRLRRALIEKWHRLGSEYTAEEEDIARVIREAETVVNTLVGRGTLPPYPLFVLSILQTREAALPHNTAQGAFGFHYEALITAALAQAVKEAASRILVETMYAYVSVVAFGMFQRKRKYLVEEELDEATAQYKDRFRMRFATADMLNVLHAARVLSRDWQGRYVFTYPHVYYYFVARYINENLRTEAAEAELRALVAHMTARLHVEEYANVIVFLVYLTRDEPTIRGLIDHGRSLYAQHPPCDLDSHMRFLGDLTGRPLPDLQLEDGQIERNNEQHLDRLDAAEELERLVEREGEGAADDLPDLHIRDEEAVDEVLKINAAIKTLQAMGQILRNFPGSLSGDIKRDLAAESYLLGLRTLQALFSLIGEDIDEVRLFFSRVLKHYRRIDDGEELAQETDRMLYAVVFGCSYGIIKQVSQAVGLEQLEETYRELADPRSPLSFALIDLAIKLDHFRRFPEREVDLVRSMTTQEVQVPVLGTQRRDMQMRPKRNVTNAFAYSLLRTLVHDHLNLLPVDARVRNSVCSKLGISVNEIKILSPADKLLRGS